MCFVKVVLQEDLIPSNSSYGFDHSMHIEGGVLKLSNFIRQHQWTCMVNSCVDGGQ